MCCTRPSRAARPRRARPCHCSPRNRCRHRYRHRDRHGPSWSHLRTHLRPCCCGERTTLCGLQGRSPGTVRLADGRLGQWPGDAVGGSPRRACEPAFAKARSARLRPGCRSNRAIRAASDSALQAGLGGTAAGTPDRILTPVAASPEPRCRDISCAGFGAGVCRQRRNADPAARASNPVCTRTCFADQPAAPACAIGAGPFTRIAPAALVA